MIKSEGLIITQKQENVISFHESLFRGSFTKTGNKINIFGLNLSFILSGRGNDKCFTNMDIEIWGSEHNKVNSRYFDAGTKEHADADQNEAKIGCETAGQEAKSGVNNTAEDEYKGVFSLLRVISI